MNIPVGKYAIALIIAIIISSILRTGFNVEPYLANVILECFIVYTIIRTLGYINELSIEINKKNNNSAERN